MDDGINEPMDTTGGDDEFADQKLINEEYKIWKKHTPLLYDMCYARALDWPTLTVQWLPTKRAVPGTRYSQHRFIFGTNTTEGAQNYLQLATVEIPDPQTPEPAQYDTERGEAGGYGTAKTPFSFNIVQKISHPSEINKARYQPQNPHIIATTGVNGFVGVWDIEKYESTPKPNTKPNISLEGHDSDCWGLSWNPHVEGQLATGSEDTTVRIWDCKRDFVKDSQRKIQASRIFKHHTAVVNDVQHHPMHPSFIGTVSDDLTFQLLDTRSRSDTKATLKQKVHRDAVNCLAFHPKWESIVATGSADKTVALWDLRNLSKQLGVLEGHSEAVVTLEWHPLDTAILASGSQDRRINMWDTSKLGEEQTEEEAEDGPPALLFMHGGFTNSVTDISWNKNDSWLMLAAAEDNQVQIFKPSRNLVNEPVKKAPHSEVSD